MEVVVVKFASFVTLESFYMFVELCLDEFVKVFEFVIGFKFKF